MKQNHGVIYRIIVQDLRTRTTDKHMYLVDYFSFFIYIIRKYVNVFIKIKHVNTYIRKLK